MYFTDFLIIIILSHVTIYLLMSAAYAFLRFISIDFHCIRSITSRLDYATYITIPYVCIPSSIHFQIRRWIKDAKNCSSWVS